MGDALVYVAVTGYSLGMLHFAGMCEQLKKLPCPSGLYRLEEWPGPTQGCRSPDIIVPVREMFYMKPVAVP